MAKRILPSLPDIKKLIGANYDRFLVAIETVQPLKYIALLTQAGTAAPTAKVLQNDLSDAIVWAYVSPGVYTGTLAAAFTADKTSLKLGNQLGGLNKATLVRTSANVVTLTTNVLSVIATVLTATATNAIITDLDIEIIVYP